MTGDASGRVRPVRDDEVEAWCACPRSEGDPDREEWIEGERAWFEEWHEGPGNLFVFDSGAGLTGKYDIPMCSETGLDLWAPSVAPGPQAGAVMRALCEHLREEAIRRGVSFVEVIVEGWGRDRDLQRECLLAAGFVLEEEKVVVHVDLTGPLPEMRVGGIELRPTVGRSREELDGLALAVGAERARWIMREPDLDRHPVALMAWREGVPVGLAWPSSAPGDEILALHHLGVVPEARGEGIGRALLAGLLARARADGATAYVGSTAVDNAAMRAVFTALGAETLGRRDVLVWR